MARPTYTNVTDGQVAVNAPLDTTLLTALRDNDEANRHAVLQFAVSEASQAVGDTTTYYTLAIRRVFIPDLADYTGVARKIWVEIEGRRTTSGTATFRVRDTTNGVNSTEVTTGSATYGYMTPELAVAASSTNSVISLSFQGKLSATNKLYLRIVDSMTSRMDY